MRLLTVNAGGAPYPLHIGRGMLGELGGKIAAAFPGADCVVIADAAVYRLYGARATGSLREAGVTAHTVQLPPGEETKSLPVLFDLYRRLTDFKISRTDVIVALGGGVIGDLAGFLAATYLRGVPLVQVPTSLLAQVDSSIGGKTAVNLPEGKNLVGSFYHPRMALIDPDVLDTLPDADFSDGMAEVVKTAAILDEALFERLEDHAGRTALAPILEDVIHRCCDVKRGVVETDERDRGQRLLLNFGHTLAHALEKVCAPPPTHGRAVAAGMACITAASEMRGLTRPGTADRLARLLRSFGLPDALPAGCRTEELMTYAGRDKKIFDGKLKVVLLERIGLAAVHPMDPAEFMRFLDRTGGGP